MKTETRFISCNNERIHTEMIFLNHGLASLVCQNGIGALAFRKKNKKVIE
jgi:hypothetical protein